MSAIDPHAADLLYPLSAFDPDDGSVLTSATILEELPQPYQMLLAHDRDMTGTLEAYFSQDMTLRVFGKKLEGDSLFRQVVLEGVEDSARVEAQQIHSALQRMEDGSYGDCMTCGEPIGEQRLDALPLRRPGR